MPIIVNQRAPMGLIVNERQPAGLTVLSPGPQGVPGAGVTENSVSLGPFLLQYNEETGTLDILFSEGE